MFHTIKLNNPDKTRGKVEQKYRLSSIATTVVNETKDSPFLAEARINATNVHDEFFEDDQDFLAYETSVNAAQTYTWKPYVRNPPNTRGFQNGTPNTPYNTNRNSRQNKPPPSSRPFTKRTPNKSFNQKTNEICEGCGLFGHNHMSCTITAKVLHVFEWSKTHKGIVLIILKKHKTMNSVNGRKAVVRNIMSLNNCNLENEDEVLESGIYDDQIEAMVNTLSHFSQE